MQLTTFSDYSLRVVMYLGLKQGDLCTIAEIAQAYAISESHLSKVVHHLALGGYIETVRGKGGGLRMLLDPKTINVGAMIRATEGEAGLLPCLSSAGVCCIENNCKLMAILREAQHALFQVLDRYTLADLLTEPAALQHILLPPKLVRNS
jgi:Rrf2 family nitric oxide-sensitive transcriptional repressor